MTRFERLKSAVSLSDLAKLLKFTPKGLAYVLYKLPDQTRYRTFTIPKAVGGVRTIEAPEPHLKLLQTRLADLLYEGLEIIEAQKPDRRRVSHGFHKKRSIVTNAKAHRRRRYVLNLDLKDFFGTINFGRVRGFFIADKNFSLDPKVATAIAQIACHNNALPQGAPSSPVISNLIGHILDARLIRLARDHSCTYTRYADDLTFSTSRRKFPRQIARASLYSPGRWILGRHLKNAIKEAGFSINPIKTRMQIRGARQETTGLVVNEKVNIRQDYYRHLRSMCNSLFQKGEYFIRAAGESDESDEPKPTSRLAPLEGRLAHLYFVKARRDLSPRDRKCSNFVTPKAPTDLYYRFLFYKYFVAPDKPTLVTEGKTDITYLKTAIKSLCAKYPQLVQKKENRLHLCIRFLNPTHINQQILNLGTGFSGMKTVIERYSSLLKHYRSLPLEHPVIFIVDHDTGGEKVLQVADKISKQEIKPKSTDPFFYIRHNLYLIKTPADAAGGMSAIEACFPEEVLKQQLDGKSFDPSKPHGDETSFGKQIFAEKIVRPGADKIDFSSFAPILDGIVNAIDDYVGRYAATHAVADASSAPSQAGAP